jgi:predicted ArsR family transcriptional regulator
MRRGVNARCKRPFPRKNRVTRERLLAAIESHHGRARPPDLARALGCPEDDVKVVLKQLEAAGLARHEGVFYDNPWSLGSRRGPA